MGRVLRREHEGSRSAFAALLTTGMIAALLAFAALAAPSPAYAAELQGSGTADDPTLIYTTDDLVAWCNSLNDMGKDQERQQHARLMEHLVSPGPDGTEHGGAVTDDVVSKMNHPDLQVAEFNGNGHLIELQLTTGDHGALFATGGQPGDAGTTKVKDLHFIGSVQHAIANSEQYAGALFERIGKEGDPSQDRKVTVVDCTNQASVFGDQATGGFIGSFVENRDGTGSITIESCSNFGEITSANGHAGGLVGSMVQMRNRLGTNYLQFCTNDGAVKSMGGWFESRFGYGGFGSSTGGLVGYLACDSDAGFGLRDDYNRGDIYNFAGGYSGGLVGYMDFPKMNCFVNSCYNTGSLQPQTGTAEYVGGLIGHAAPFTRTDGSVTMRESVPSGSVSDSTRNGTLIYEYDFYYDADEYLDNNFDGALMLSGVGEARNIKAKLIDPTTGSTSYESASWNTCLSLPSPDASIEGYRFAYWTIDAPDVGGTYNEPPREYKFSDFNDPGQRAYGGDVTLYAYYEPSAVTVKFDLNKPAEGSYTCSLDPEGATKTLAKGEPVGALPTAACVNPNDKNDTRAFLGWATKKDGNDPKAEWVSESSDNLYRFRDAETNIVMLYAQWADTSVGLEITYQPKDCRVSALAEYPTHDVCFDFCTTYEDYSATLQYRKNSSSGYEDLDVPHAAMPNQFHFDLESADEAAGDYRIKIEYYDSLSQLGTLYTSSAKIVMDIPQSEAKVTLIELSDPKPSVAEDNLEKDEILGTASYDVDFRISDDSLPKLVGDESDEIRHRAWIEGGPSNTSPGNDVRLNNKMSGTLENQHLVEGQTYTLCVSRWFPHSDYAGESEPYRVSFVVPYTKSIPAKIHGVMVTQDPVVENGHPSGWVDTDYNIGIHEEFNLGANVEYQYMQPEGRQVHVQWQYGVGGTWVDVPDELFVKDEQGNPICGFAWDEPYRKSGRAYATLKAEAKLDNKAFRVKLSTPSAPVDTISNSSLDELRVLVPTPKDMQVKVNDTDVSVSWTWEDAVGNTKPTDGYYVSIERDDSTRPDQDYWVEVSRGQVYENTYQATLDPQQNYRVSVRAGTDGLQSSSVQKEFSTLGEPGLTWENLSCTAYLPSKQQNDEISVDFDWAGYNDGKHLVEYSWSLNRDKYGKGAYEHFATTESDSVNFPEDFEGGNVWDPTEAWWVKVEARVWLLTDEGEPWYIVDSIQSSALPVWHETSESQNLTVKDIGSHSMTVCWDAPAEGLVREYEVKVTGGRSWIVPAEAEKNKDGHYEVTIDGLDSDTEYYVTVYTVDSWLQRTNLPGSTSFDHTTLPSPEVGTWTVAADPSNVKQGEEVTLSASYAANSGKFPMAAELQWYSWREGEADWQSEGDPITLDSASNDGSKDYTTTLKHTVTSKDYGRQWKLGAKATSPDESVTDSSNVVTATITPPTPTDVACDAPTPTSLPVSWTPVDDVDGYQIKCVKLDIDGNPVSATTYSVAASSLKPDAGGKLCYEVMNLEPDTTYRVSVAAFVHGVTGEFSAALEPRTLAEPNIETPVFQQVPKTTWVEANEDATFTAQAKVNDGGTITYAWQRKGAGEQDFAPIADGDKYVIGENGGVATLTVKSVGADDVSAAFRCVATSSKDNQTANAASATAYLTVIPAEPKEVKAQATSATTGEVTWAAEGIVRRFAVTWQQVDPSTSKLIGSEYSRIVTISNDETQGTCQLDGLQPGANYAVSLYAAPEAGFRSEKVTASLYTPAASALETATVTPDKTLVEPGEEVTFKVETNVDGLLPEQLEYRWQRNTFGETWIDVEGDVGTKKTLSVKAPEGGSVDGYRCIVTSTRTTIGEKGQVVGTDTKSVTSSVGVLLTSVPVAPPVQLAAEPGTTSVHLTWASGDPRDVTYQVQYAEGPTPNDDAWQTVDNVGSSTSCDVEGLKANTVYSWRVQAVVRDQLWSEWAQADTFTTLEEPSALATVSVTPRWGTAVAGSDKGVAYTAVTNIDNALNGETLSYQWQDSATGDEWSNVQGATTATYVADTSDATPRSCQYRCVVTASKDGVPLKTITSESVNFRTTAVPPTSLLAGGITAATADLSWNGSPRGASSCRVLWRASGTDAWTSTPDLTEAKYTLNSLMPATTYEWYVQVMNNGEPSARSVTSLFVTQSLSPIPQLTRVVVGPLDQTPAAAEQAKFTAYTNVDDMADATMAYKWEMRDLDSDPSNPSAWTTLADKTTREIKLDPGMDGYVRCTVTYTPPTSAFVQPLANTPVTSTNEARVRVMPAAPSNLTVNAVGKTIADISWTGGAGGPAFDLVYRVVGSSEWTSVPGLDSASTNLVDLKPGTMYEWNVRSVAYGASGDPLRSDWIAGPLFKTNPEDIVFSRAWVTPSATSVMAGADSTVTLTANTDADTGETLTYQWQHLAGDTWQDVGGKTSSTLEVSTKDLSVGTYAYRCQVKATRGGQEKTVESNESVVTVMPAAPTDLSVGEFVLVDPAIPTGSVKTAFHWKWGGTGALPDDATFEVSYRKLAGPGAILDGWVSEGLTVDNENRTCEAVLESKDITYQWRVRVMQNGATSPWSETNTFTTKLEEHTDISYVEVAPSDSLVSNDAAATVTLTASTNVDSDPTLKYEWQWCPLTTKDPRKDGAKWETIEGESTGTITLSGDNRNRYVRCVVTQTVGGTAKTKASNPACVRTEPLRPYDLSANAADRGGIRLSWKCDDERAENAAQKNVIGYEVNYRKIGTSEWAEEVSSSKYDCKLDAQMLESDATYEWRVRTILSGDVGELTKGGPHTEWEDGPVFAAPKVAVTPTRAAAVIGNGRTLTFTAMPNAVITGGTYQWQRNDGSGWKNMLGEESATLNIVADNAVTAGTSRYRCVVTMGGYTTISNEVTCTLAPAAPANLTASGVTSSEAKLAWDWAQRGLPNADEFKVLYRESGAKIWETATAAGSAREFVLKDLKPETIYEWRVRAVQNGVESLPSFANLFVTASEHPALKLESVLVDPSDQAVAPEAEATVKATTNLDGMVDPGELTYVWEKRALDSNPSASDAWQTIEDEKGSSVTSSVITSGFVRCKVTYTPAGSAAAETVVSNEASVRVQPVGAPTGLEVKDIGDTAATFAWGGAVPTNGSFTLLYRTAGTEAWTTVPKLTASPYTAQDLAPNTTYEWRMCSVSADGLTSEWVDGAGFKTTAQDAVLGEVKVAPERAEAVAGDSALVEDFFATVTGTAEGQSLAYQWQVLLSGTWTNLPGETGERTHLSVANLEPGEYSLRCVVTATAPGGKSKTVESNKATLALSLATPSDLSVQRVTRGAAMLTWTWAGPGAVDSFNVRYREEGASDAAWVNVPTDSIDPASTTCIIKGLAPSTSYEWQVQAVQGDQTSAWVASGFVTLSDGPLKVARIWPSDVTVAKDEQARFVVFTNRGDAEDVSYEWQRRGLYSEDVEGSWETIPNATGRVLTLDANTAGYVRCVATQAAPAAQATEVVETSEAVEAPQAVASNETIGANEAPDANETNEASETNETTETTETPVTPVASEVAETSATPTPPSVAISNQARVRVEPSVPSGLAVGAAGLTNAALSWAAADVDGVVFALAYRVAGSSDWTEVPGLTAPAYELGGLVQGTSYEWRVQAVVGTGDDALKSAWAYGDSFTTQTMRTYHVTAGADGTWKPGQPGLAFTIDAPRDKFLSLAVDGAELVQGADYTVVEGSTVLTLSSDYLASLEAGKHELVATFSDGAASTTFTVAAAEPPTPSEPSEPSEPETPGASGDQSTSPAPLPSGGKALAPTGDPLSAALPLVGMLAVASVCVAIAAFARKRWHALKRDRRF